MPMSDDEVFELRLYALTLAVDAFERHIQRAYISESAPAVEAIRLAVLAGMVAIIAKSPLAPGTAETLQDSAGERRTMRLSNIRTMLEKVAADLEADAGPPPQAYEECLATMRDSAVRLRALAAHMEPVTDDAGNLLLAKARGEGGEQP